VGGNFSQLNINKMASCEKCWGDAYFRSIANPMKSQAEHYGELIEERAENPCTPEEQGGECATKCPACKRIAVHQYAKVCCACGHKPTAPQPKTP